MPQLARALKRVDGWAFSIFAAVVSFPFFAHDLKSWWGDRVGLWTLIVVALANLLLARLASLLAQCMSSSAGSAWVWGAGFMTAPLFSASGMISVLSLQPNPWFSGNETAGVVMEGILGLFAIWLTSTMILTMPLCMAGAAIFFLIHRIVLKMRRSAQARNAGAA
jgi:hypothetical protein